MKKSVLGLIGSGGIGGTIAHLAALKNWGSIVLFDVAADLAKGKALDLSHIASIENKDSRVIGTGDYADLEACDVVIVTAGLPRKPGMSRNDLLEKNTEIIRSVGAKLKKHCPQAFIIVVTNPLDAMAWVMQQETGFPPSQIVGMAGALDSARFSRFLAQEMDVCIEDIQAMVLGGHGDAMVPLPRYTTVAGIPLPELIRMGWLSQQRLDALIQRTRQGGAEIVSLLKNGSAFYAPATCALAMADAYRQDRKRIFPCSVFLDGAYGMQNVYAGVPALIGAGGVERILELPLNDEEQNLFQQSVAGVHHLIDTIKVFQQKS